MSGASTGLRRAGGTPRGRCAPCIGSIPCASIISRRCCVAALWATLLLRSRGCACSTSAAAPASSPSRWRPSAPSVTGVDPAANNIEIARTHAEAGGLTIDYRVALPPQDAARRLARHSTPCSSWRWWSMCATGAAFCTRRPALVRPGGVLVAGDAEPHVQELCVGYRRRRICSRLGAARHARLAAVRDAGRTRGRPSRRRPEDPRLRGRRLRSCRVGDGSVSADTDINYMMAATRVPHEAQALRRSARRTGPQSAPSVAAHQGEARIPGGVLPLQHPAPVRDGFQKHEGRARPSAPARWAIDVSHVTTASSAAIAAAVSTKASPASSAGMS